MTRRGVLASAGAGIPIAQLAKQAGVVESTSEALRLIAQRGLKVDGEVVADKGLVVPAGSTVVVQAGKRKFARSTATPVNRWRVRWHRSSDLRKRLPAACTWRPET